MSTRMSPEEFKKYILKRNPIQLAYHDCETGEVLARQEAASLLTLAVNACSKIVEEVPDLEEASYNLFESWLQACDLDPTAFLITVRNLNAGNWFVTVDNSGLPPTDPEMCEHTMQLWKAEYSNPHLSSNSECHSPSNHHHHQLRAIFNAAPRNGAEVLQKFVRYRRVFTWYYRSHNLDMGGDVLSEHRIVCLGEMSAINKTAFEMKRANTKPQQNGLQRFLRRRKVCFR